MNVQTVPYQEQVTTARVVLKNVSWQTFKALLADIGDSRATRIAYVGYHFQNMKSLNA